MKFCPTCQSRYDEEILRFCTKDGTPLIDEEEPNFTELPSESAADDESEETIVRRKSAGSIPPSQPGLKQNGYARAFVIPTSEEKPPQQQQVRRRDPINMPPKRTRQKRSFHDCGTGHCRQAGGVLFIASDNADIKFNRSLNL